MLLNHKILKSLSWEELQVHWVNLLVFITEGSVLAKVNIGHIRRWTVHSGLPHLYDCHEDTTRHTSVTPGPQASSSGQAGRYTGGTLKWFDHCNSKKSEKSYNVQCDHTLVELT